MKYAIKIISRSILLAWVGWLVYATICKELDNQAEVNKLHSDIRSQELSLIKCYANNENR